MMERNLTCIICPRGCSLNVKGEKGALTVTGNACPKGEIYGKEECTCPVRTVTGIVRVENRTDTMLSVKTSVPAEKQYIFDIMKAINKTSVKAPVKIGDIIIKDLFGTDIIATKTVE